MPRAGLDAAVVTEAGARLADELGLAQLSMGALAERLGVKPPSLYKHVTGQSDLIERIALLGVQELGDAICDATRGVVGRDALVAGAGAMRAYVVEHPGRYAAVNGARPRGPEDPFVAASRRTLDCLAGLMDGYPLPPSRRVHALRAVRSVVHGFASLEAAGAFQLQTGVDESFAWIVDLLDAGLRATVSQAEDARPAEPAQGDGETRS